MSTSFPFVQVATATAPVGHSAPGDISVAFSAPVAFGNIIVACWSGFQAYTPYPNQGPTACADSNSNTYYLFGQTNGGAENSQLYAQIWIAISVIGGSNVVNFTGASTMYQGSPSAIVLEYECPVNYEIFGIDNAGSSGCSFRGCANNSPGSGSSDTGNDYDTGTFPFGAYASGQIGITNNGTAISFTIPCTCIALMNQFLDVTLILLSYAEGDYAEDNVWSCAANLQDGTSVSGNVRAFTTEYSGDPYHDNQTLCVSDYDFPYLNGPPQADCDEPPNGSVGVLYGPSGDGHSIVISGGASPYTVTFIGGIIPPGLSLSSAGLISGTPTTAGLFYFTLQITDSEDTIVIITCSIAICGAGATIGGNFAYYSRH